MEIKVKLTFGDVFRYNLYVGYKSIFSKVIVLIGLAVLGYIVYKFSVADGPILDVISRNIIAIIVMFLALCSKFIKIWKITAMQATSPIFQKTSTYKFAPDSIYLELDDQSDTISWTIYQQIKETNNDFRFFVDAVQAQIVPKHDMTTEQIENLRKFIEQAVPKEKYILKG
ncbi:YcxB family protein [Candidatus Epulonipiscium viviparus]|uniref:YcxB family protein n=1 Tax=Candidatus Epulonipiscium viviparus TaxID=420336 RepID=UPI00016BFB45|nr:YcxB family protein [Candidatus Epulopiscium viviparus]